MTTEPQNVFSRVFKATSRLEPNELKATFVSFAFVFILMAAYYILRPVRDAMASDWSDAEVSFLWTLNLIISIGIVALYGYAVARIRFQYLVPSVYGFFSASFIIFFLAASAVGDRTLVDKSFYVWVSVFSLFHLSVFWSFMADLFTKEQAKRVFAVVAAGTSAGALVGPWVPTFFAGLIGNDILMLIAAIMLVLPVPLVFYLGRLKSTDLHNEAAQSNLAAVRIGGNPFAGYKLFIVNPYLLAIGVFILLYTMIGSFIYFEQKNLLEKSPFQK
ncbi:MAG: MFS transporter, partial [Gammaproteobacteria bacterium]|nr:MFS transporter [Gammaproteobacteria bacterium]